MHRRAYGALIVTGTSVVLAMLVRTTGPPAAQARVLHELAAPGADPVGGVLAGLALVAELLAGYVLAVVVLRLLVGLPGLPGRMAAAGARAVTVPALRRALDGLLGGAFLAQAVLVPLGVAGQQAEPPWPVTPATVAGGLPTRAVPDRLAGGDLVPDGPAPGGGAPPPLPTWLAGPRCQPGLPSAGSGPPPASAAPPAAKAAAPPATAMPGRRIHVIEVGDTLWGIAASYLPATDRPDAVVDADWRQLYAANRAVLGDDPDRIHPGTRLTVPPLWPGRR